MRTKLNITEGIFPMPVLMVATYNEDGSVNVMNAAWGTMFARSGLTANKAETVDAPVINVFSLRSVIYRSSKIGRC